MIEALIFIVIYFLLNILESKKAKGVFILSGLGASLHCYYSEALAVGVLIFLITIIAFYLEKKSAKSYLLEKKDKKTFLLRFCMAGVTVVPLVVWISKFFSISSWEKTIYKVDLNEVSGLLMIMCALLFLIYKRERA